jgi:hypothetical protein
MRGFRGWAACHTDAGNPLLVHGRFRALAIKPPVACGWTVSGLAPARGSGSGSG